MADSQYNLDIVIKAQNEASQELKKVNQQLTGITKIAGYEIIGKKLLSGVKDLSSEILTLGGNLEQAEVAFTTMLGSEEKANKLLKDLTTFAKKTPFELTGIRDSAKQLLAMGIESDNLLPTLKALGDVSAGLGVDLSRLAYNFGQVKSQGHLTGVELRDFTRAGVPIISELATMLGKTETEIQKMVSAGEIGFDLVEKAFVRMTSEGGRFEDLMIKQSGTYQGMMSNLNDSLNSMKEAIGRTFIPLLERVFEKISPILEKISEWIEENPELATTIATVVAGGVALTGALMGIGAVLPMITAGLSVLTSNVGLLGTAFGITEGALKRLESSIISTDEKVKLYRDGIAELDKQLQAGTISQEGYNKKVDEYNLQIEQAYADSQTLGGYLKDQFDEILKVMTFDTNTWKEAWESFGVIFNAIGDMFDRVASFIGSTMIVVWNEFNNVVSILSASIDTLTGSLINFVSKGIDRALGKVDTLISKLKRLIETAKEAVSLVGGKVSSAWNSVKGGVSSLFGKASGGLVYAGTPYLVGEHGPELFTPSQRGMITPNNQITNNNGIEINISGVSVRNDDDIQSLADEIVRKIKLEKQFGIN